MSAQNIHIDLLTSQTQIGALTIDQPSLLVQRDASGFNLRQLLPQQAKENLDQNERNGIQMRLAVKKAEAKSGTLEFIDQTVNPEANSQLQDLNAVVTSMSVLPSFSAEQITAKGQLGKGSLDVTGAIHDDPLKGEFSIVGRKLPFLPYSGYLNELFNAANSSGDSIDGEIKLAFAPGDNGEITTSISGHMEGHNMGLEFPDKQEQILATERLRISLNTIRLGARPRVDIGQIAFSDAHPRAETPW